MFFDIEKAITAFTTTLLASQVVPTLAQAPSSSQYTAAQIADGTAFKNISEIAQENMQWNLNQRTNPSCTYENANVRKEWRTLDTATRKSFTDALVCLQNHAPTHMTEAEAPNYPGVKSRFDEYVATHINYTYNIHATADFFAWHRTFIHFLEKDLQELCGYTGVLPYWNWALDAQAPQNSPLFNGDEYSMGGNGEYVANQGNTWLAAQVRLAYFQRSSRIRN
jgi:tyrosinase